MRRLSLLLSLFMLLLSPPASAQTRSDEEANRLFVQAVQLWNRAKDEPVAQQAGTLREVQANLQAIIDRHGGATLAVRLVIGETIGPLSLVVVEREVRRASEAEARFVREATLQAMNAAAGVGRMLRDCPECPEMVVVPAGAASLASGRDVFIAAPFAVGKFEVTFAEWDECVAQGGCGHRPDDEGWGRGRQPVINVNWYDAQAYVAWLSRKTGKSYRLLSEAEWEYAAQAWTGREAKAVRGTKQVNCSGCGSRWDNRQTAPVGSFLANAFGLNDMLGNVWEWAADCWNETHSGATAEGSARASGICSRRVLRGGSWGDDPVGTRSAFRNWYSSDLRYRYVGFRVARTL